MGKRKRLNSTLFSFAFSNSLLTISSDEKTGKESEKILMEDIVNTVGEFLVGWEGGLVRALDEP